MSTPEIKPRFSLPAQLVSAVILLMAAMMKFKGDPASIEVFTQLEMEPTGRYLIGAIELAAGLLLLSPFAATGALLAVGVMTGAIIAHATYLGLEVDGDGGRLVMLLFVVLICSTYVLLTRRRELPLLGSSFD
jgi:putative oxidoreductase